MEAKVVQPPARRVSITSDHAIVTTTVMDGAAAVGVSYDRLAPHQQGERQPGIPRKVLGGLRSSSNMK
jgi:hypothetical protein